MIIEGAIFILIGLLLLFCSIKYIFLARTIEISNELTFGFMAAALARLLGAEPSKPYKLRGLAKLATGILVLFGGFGFCAYGIYLIYYSNF